MENTDLNNTCEGETTNYTYEGATSTSDNSQSAIKTVQHATVGSAAVKYDTPGKSLLEAPVLKSPVVSPVVSNSKKPISLLEAPPTRPMINVNTKETESSSHTSINARPSEQTQQVCKDYLNKKCHRTNCRFLHLTKEDSENYSQTRKISPNVQQFSGVKNDERGTPIQGKRPYSSLVAGGIKMPIGTPKQVNEELKMKLVDLRKQVVELTSLNDTLYTENQKYRSQLSGVNGGSKISLLPKPMTVAGNMY